MSAHTSATNSYDDALRLWAGARLGIPAALITHVNIDSSHTWGGTFGDDERLTGIVAHLEPAFGRIYRSYGDGDPVITDTDNVALGELIGQVLDAGERTIDTTAIFTVGDLTVTCPLPTYMSYGWMFTLGDLTDPDVLAFVDHLPTERTYGSCSYQFDGVTHIGSVHHVDDTDGALTVIVGDHIRHLR
jgi:hypothetical protein